MSQRCCSKLCLLQNVAYGMVFNGFINGLRLFWDGGFETIFLGLLFIAFGIVLVVGLRKASVTVILTFLVGESVLLAIDLVKSSTRLADLEEIGDKKKVFLILNIAGNLVNWAMLGVLLLYYRTLNTSAENEDEKGPKSNETDANQDGRQSEKKNDCDQI